MKRRRAWPRILAGYGFAASLPALAFAQRAPGADFQVNQYTVDAQDGAQISPAPGGGFVAVWESYRQDGSLDGLFGGRFDRLGTPIGREFQINSYTTGNQFGGPVYTDGDGNFVVLWQRFAPTSNLVGRRFDRTGTPLTSEFVVSASATANSPSMARGRDGRFLVAWRAFSGVDGLQARWFDATAAPVGAEFTLKAGVGGGGVVSRPQGGFLGFWSQGGRIDGRLFDDVGNPQGAEFPLATAVTFSQPDSVAVDASGAFVVVWGRGENLDRDVYMRRFDAGGQPLGAELLVNADTTQFRYNGTAAFLGDGSFVVMWTTGNSVFDVAARQFDASGVPMGPEFVLPAYSGYFQAPGVLQPMPGGHMIATWTTDDLDGSGSASYARLFGVVPMALAVDAIAGQSNGNGVLEPGEAVVLSPSWANALRAPLPMSGTLSDFVGPGTATYSILDAAADYGAPPVGSTGACTAAGDCYTLAVSDPSPRPATHWDATVFERVSGGGALHWTVHVGRSFADVPVSGAFYRFVETMLHRSITAGCGGGLYCPGDAASREQMAVFVLVAREAAGYAPPACTTPVFDDVPAGSAFCRFIEELARRGVVSGCGGGSYCPTSPVTREQMAVFALRTLDPTLDPPACATPRFNDVPASSPFCRWIEELARRGVVTGCGGGSYCPAAPVTREQMAAFIGVTFGLTLYGP